MLHATSHGSYGTWPHVQNTLAIDLLYQTYGCHMRKNGRFAKHVIMPCCGTDAHVWLNRHRLSADVAQRVGNLEPTVRVVKDCCKQGLVDCQNCVLLQVLADICNIEI